MNQHDFDEWNRAAIISRALEYRSDAVRYRRELIEAETAHARCSAKYDRLREHNNTLKLALSEALDEIEAMTDTSAMGAGRIAQHRLWMAGMRAALEGKETSDE
jgi:hypothetical protein